MEDNKKWYLSATLWGIIISLAFKILFAVNVIDVPEGMTSEEVASQWQNIGLALLSVIGDAIAAWGRMRAKTTLTK